MKKLKAVIFVIILAAAVWLIVSPRVTVQSLRSAAQAGDAEQVDKYVDFDAVRANLKADVKAAMMKKADDKPFAAFGVLVTGALVDRLVDAFVSPSGIAALARGQRPDADDGSVERRAPRDYNINRTSLNRFVVRFEGSADAPKLIFRRRGLHWEMTRIDFEHAES